MSLVGHLTASKALSLLPQPDWLGKRCQRLEREVVCSRRQLVSQIELINKLKRAMTATVVRNRRQVTDKDGCLAVHVGQIVQLEERSLQLRKLCEQQQNELNNRVHEVQRITTLCDWQQSQLGFKDQQLQQHQHRVESLMARLQSQSPVSQASCAPVSVVVSSQTNPLYDQVRVCGLFAVKLGPLCHAYRGRH